MKKGFYIIIVFVIFSNEVSSQKSTCIDSIYNDASLEERYQDIFISKVFMKNATWQSGYLVMNNGDTIYGDIKVHTSGIHVSIKNQFTKKKIRADKYKSFKYGDKYFVSKSFEGYPFNVQVIEYGQVCLYAYEQVASYPMMSNGEHLKSFYIEKGTNVFGPFNLDWTDKVASKSWMRECFGDYDLLFLKLKEKNKLKFQDLLKACKSYNCHYD